MQKHYDLPGSPAWSARRANSFNAADAAAMLACSPVKTRTQLMHELFTGIAPEFSDFVQDRVIDPGHRIEELCRPIGEEILGEDLQVLAGSLGVGLSRPLGASLDGMTFMEDDLWECKTVNDELRAALPHAGRDSHQHNDAKALPKDKRVQMEQQLLVTGASRVLFSAAKFDRDGNVQEERHAFYHPDQALRADILAGWKQFEIDLAAYIPPAASAVEKIVAEPVEQLPAPVVQVTGTLALVDNFKVFEERLRDFLANKLIKAPKVDQDFADLDLQIKAMKQGREALKGAKAQMLGQVQPIDQATKTADMLDKMLQQACSAAESLLKDEKERRRGEIVTGGATALKAHIDGLNQRLGKPYMPAIPSDFPGCVKGLKSLASMEDRVAGELARCKIAANEVADRLDLNLKFLREHAKDHAFLFADTGTIVLKASDDFQTLVRARIAEHKAEEQRKEDATRERIRAEEQARADKEARDRLAAEQAERDRVASEQAAEAAKPAPTPAPPAAASPALSSQAPAPNVVQMPRATTAPAAPATQPTLTLGAIKDRIAPLQIDAAGLALLGFKPAATQGAAKLFHDADLALMLAAMVRHLESVQAKAAA